MLYDAWLKVARDRNRETALWDLSADRRWRFDELLREAGRETADARAWTYPQGHSAGFILSVLRGWRAGAVVCPLEPGQSPPDIPLPPSRSCHVKMTSATSGKARAVLFTPEQLAADVRNIMNTMGLRPEWPNLGAISLAHSYGFSNLVLPLLLHGVPLILAQSPLPEMVKAAAAGHAGLTLPGVPALWRGWSDANAIPSSVRLAISAGAPLKLDLEQTIHAQYGLKIHNFYGASECGGIAYDSSPLPRKDEACVGRAMNGVELAAAPNGCLEVRSGAAGEAYWPESDAALGGGVFTTSDLAEIKDGCVYLQGRLGDQINVAGRKVAPEIVESALRSHPGVKDCLVFGVPATHGDRTDNIAACVVSEMPVEEKELKQFLQRLLPAWQIPREWWFVPSLPAGERGKISRVEWARRYLEVRNRSAATDHVS